MRNQVGTGADVLIAGFYVSGTGTKTLLIRGVGPGLAALGVSGALADPLLQLFDSRGTLLETNDNWDAALAPTFASVGAFPLSAGNLYSVQVSGVGGGTGDSIVELYELPDPLTAARLPKASTRGDVALGFPRIPDRLPTTGTVRFKVIFVDFRDQPASRTPQSVFSIISPGAESLFRELSYGKLNVVLEADFRWVRMNKASTEYGWPSPTFNAHRAYIQEALDLAVAAGTSFAAADSFIVMANPDTLAFTSGPAFTPVSAASGVTASGGTFVNGATSGRDFLTWGYKWFNHEIGHALSLPDLYAFSGATHRFVGDYSLMSFINGTAPELLAWERWRLGWLDDTQVECPPSGTSVVALSPVETPGVTKLIVVPAGRTTAVAVESRRPLGYDTNLTRPGLLVYYIDTSINSGEGVVKVPPPNEADTRKLNATLIAGQSLTHEGVTVRFVSGDASLVNVQITRP